MLSSTVRFTQLHHSCCLTFGYTVSKDFLAQAGDPTATGTGGESIWSFIASQNGGGDVPRYFTPEIVPRLKHTEKGTVSMAVAPTVEGQHAGGCGSQFFITLADGIEYLDGKHAVFGHVVEGLFQGYSDTTCRCTWCVLSLPC